MSRPAAWTTDFRYHSSWVLAQNGIATSLPFQVEPWIALSTTPWLTRWATSAGTGARKPACANSGIYGGSRLMMSIDESPAARRRTSCSRWEGESRGSWAVARVKRPPAAPVHPLGISACPPEWGLMYQVRVGGPPDEPPQAARVEARTSAAAAPTRPRRLPRPAREPPTFRFSGTPTLGACGTVIASVGGSSTQHCARSVVHVTERVNSSRHCSARAL